TTGIASEAMRSRTANSPPVVSPACVSVGSPSIAVPPRLYDGRAVTGCAGGTVSRLINYVGLQYYRGGINHQSFYTHTLPINWNKKTGDPATQKYTCGDGSFRRAHIAAAS